MEYALCTKQGQIAQYRNMSLFPAYLPAMQSADLDQPDAFFGGQRIVRLFATDVTKISRLNRTPAWGEATRYLEQELSHWAASGMPSQGFFDSLEQKMQHRLDLPCAPKSSSTDQVPLIGNGVTGIGEGR